MDAKKLVPKGKMDVDVKAVSHFDSLLHQTVGKTIKGKATKTTPESIMKNIAGK